MLEFLKELIFFFLNILVLLIKKFIVLAKKIFKFTVKYLKKYYKISVVYIKEDYKISVKYLKRDYHFIIKYIKKFYSISTKYIKKFYNYIVTIDYKEYYYKILHFIKRKKYLKRFKKWYMDSFYNSFENTLHVSCLILSLLIFVSLNIWFILFDVYESYYQMNVSIKLFKFYFYLGVDGLSFLFIYLTGLIIPLCMLYIYNSKLVEKGDYIICLFCLEILLFLVFSVLDLFLFYFFFEIILIPFFIMIGINGINKRRTYASYLLFFYTLFGSLLMLAGIFYLFINVGSTDFYILWATEFDPYVEKLLWIAFFTSFAIKVPIFPFHIWLPEAHVESPTEISVILASLLLKIGLYGFLKILIPIFTNAHIYFSSIVFVLSTVSIFYTSFTTLRQVDIKRIIAYSSIAHMNFAVLGLINLNMISLVGSITLMFGHAFISSGLFFLVGFLYDRYGTKTILYYSGIAYTMPLFSTFLLLFMLGNISFPLTSNFIGEFLVIIGLFYEYKFFPFFFIFISIFFCTIYTMWVYNKICFGLPNYKFGNKHVDLKLHEFFILFVLFFFMILIGIYPNIFIDFIYNSLYLYL